MGAEQNKMPGLKLPVKQVVKMFDFMGFRQKKYESDVRLLCLVASDKNQNQASL